MKFKEELIIIRHARSQHNAGVSQNLDSEITGFGKLQAEALAEFMSKKMQLYSFEFQTSPFLRCLQTATPIAKKLNVKFKVNTVWHEYLNHSKGPVTIPNRSETFQEHFNWCNLQQDNYTFNDEFNEDFIDRIHSGYLALPEKSVVVTHGLPAFMLLKVAIGNLQSVPIWDYSLDNCSITKIVGGRVIWQGRGIPAEGLISEDL
jgi:broad specificity phosphatase PhoE